jgi:hypothetical protein
MTTEKFRKFFTERDDNEQEFVTHTVGYETYNLWDNEKWLWRVGVERKTDGKYIELEEYQYADDSAKYHFYSMYKKICKMLDLQPVEID